MNETKCAFCGHRRSVHPDDDECLKCACEGFVEAAQKRSFFGWLLDKLNELGRT